MKLDPHIKFIIILWALFLHCTRQYFVMDIEAYKAASKNVRHLLHDEGRQCLDLYSLNCRHVSASR